MGLAQMSGGSGASAASILKSPVGDSRTPARGVTLSVKGGVGSQIRVANTDCPAARPALFPPPKINPFPSTVMRPFALTLASSSSITQIWPAGCTPRTMFRVTLGATKAVVAAPLSSMPDETGMTPIPPLHLNLTGSVCAAADAASALCEHCGERGRLRELHHNRDDGGRRDRGLGLRVLDTTPSPLHCEISTRLMLAFFGLPDYPARTFCLSLTGG